MRFAHSVIILSATTKSGEEFEGLIRLKFMPRNPGYVVAVRVNSQVKVFRRKSNQIDVEREVQKFMSPKFKNWRIRWATYQEMDMNSKMGSVPIIPRASMK